MHYTLFILTLIFNFLGAVLKSEHTVEDLFESFEPDLTVVRAQVVQMDGVVLQFKAFLLAMEKCDAQQSAACLLSRRSAPFYLHSEHVLELHVFLLLLHITLS